MATAARRGVSYAIIAAALIAPWEGLWTTAKPDKLAYDLPTVCYGMTPHDRQFKVGDKFTPEQCKQFLVEDIPKYKKPLEKCVHVELSQHQWAALASASYNAGPAAVCKSPMVRAFNAHDPRACDYFVGPPGHPERGWYVRAGGKFRQGLANRREAERKVCNTKD